MITVRPYTQNDAVDFLKVYRACLSYYEIPAATTDQEHSILSLLNAERHMACHLAYAGDTCVGFATWGLSFPAGSGTSLVMKELFVTPASQGTGVGRTLLAELTRVAERENCVRLDWATDGSNAASQAFYATLGAPVKLKVSYSVPSSDFASFRNKIRE